MKDEEFQRKLELILEEFEKIDLEARQLAEKEKLEMVNEIYDKGLYSRADEILEGKYNRRKTATENTYQ